MLVKQSSKRCNVKLCESCTENHKGIRVLVKLPITTWVSCRGKYSSSPLDQRPHELLQQCTNIILLLPCMTLVPLNISWFAVWYKVYQFNYRCFNIYISLIRVTGKNHLWYWSADSHQTLTIKSMLQKYGIQYTEALWGEQYIYQLLTNT